MKRSRIHGFTLVEVIVVVAITGVIMIAITQSVLSFYKANRVSLEESYQIRSAQKGLDALVRDLREATYGDDGAYPLATMGSSTLVFYSDVDHTSPIEKITYVLSGTSLTRRITSSSGTPPAYTGSGVVSTVSDYVRNTEDNVAMFRYYDASGNEVTNSSHIRDVISVSVTLVVDITPAHAPGEFTLKSSASFRNLRSQ